MSAVEGGRASITVGLFDERALRRHCLARFLEVSGLRLRVVTANNGAGAESLLSAAESIDLLIIDIGDRACREPSVRRIFDHLRRSDPNVPIVVVSDREERSAIIDAMSLGARAYFPSSLDPEMLVETLRYVQKGGTFIPPCALMNASEHGKPALAPADPIGPLGLTERERHVLELLQQGKSNKAIGRELQIEEGTVKVHVRRIMKKLHADNRTQAALLAQQFAALVN